MPKFNHKIFFDGAREFLQRQGRGMTQERVNGLEFLLTQFEKTPQWFDLRHIAYALATMCIETDWRFQPIQEYGGREYFERRYGSHTRKGRELGNDVPGEGAKYSGKGYVQLTGESNYEKLETIIRRRYPQAVAEFETRTGRTFDLTDFADEAKDPHLAFVIMTIGMFEGVYTGKAFRHYINDSICDWFNARRIINGTDRAQEIANYAQAWFQILRKALISSSGTIAAPVPVVEEENPLDIDDVFKSVSQGGIKVEPDLEEKPATEPANEQQAASTSKVEITPGGGIKAETTEGQPKVEEWVAVEKAPNQNFVKKMWAKISGLFVGESAVNGLTDKWGQVQTLGLSHDTWRMIFYLALVCGLIWILSEVYQHWQRKKEEKERDALLTKANSIDGVLQHFTFAAKEDLEYLKQRGYRIVERGK